MGSYKGRVNLRKRKKRFAKAQRIKTLAATKKGTTQRGEKLEVRSEKRMRMSSLTEILGSRSN